MKSQIYATPAIKGLIIFSTEIIKTNTSLSNINPLHVEVVIRGSEIYFEVG